MTPLCALCADPADPGMNSGRLNPMHQANTSGLFSGKGPPNFNDFQGEAQGEGQGSLRRPKEVQSHPKARIQAQSSSRPAFQSSKENVIWLKLEPTKASENVKHRSVIRKTSSIGKTGSQGHISKFRCFFVFTCFSNF